MFSWIKVYICFHLITIFFFPTVFVVHMLRSFNGNRNLLFVLAVFILYISSILVIMQQPNAFFFVFSSAFFPGYEYFTSNGICYPPYRIIDWQYFVLIMVPVTAPGAYQSVLPSDLIKVVYMTCKLLEDLCSRVLNY